MHKRDACASLVRSSGISIDVGNTNTQMRNRNSLVFTTLLLVGLLVLVPLTIAVLYGEDESNIDPSFYEFYQQELSGEVIDFYRDRGAVYVQIDNLSNKKLAIWPETNKSGRFYDMLSNGDSLVKKKNSKFFVLKKSNDQIHEYTIRTFFLDNESSQ